VRGLESEIGGCKWLRGLRKYFEKHVIRWLSKVAGRRFERRVLSFSGASRANGGDWATGNIGLTVEARGNGETRAEDPKTEDAGEA
jgi:hypothetical protein